MTFDATTMWQASKAEGGWVSVQVAFPYEVELSQIAVHSQHSGEYHIAKAVRIAVRVAKDQYRTVTEADLEAADGTVTLPKTKGRDWRFEFRAGENQCVVLRGLQFFSDADELFPPLVPYAP